MKVLERTPRRIVMQQQTRLAAVLSLVGILVLANVAWRLSDTAPPQQAYLIWGLALCMLYVFYQSMQRTTITIDLTNQRLEWVSRTLLRSRQAHIDLAQIAQARLDTRRSQHYRQVRKRSRAELVFHEHVNRAPFALTPHHLPGPDAQYLANEINAALTEPRR